MFRKLEIKDGIKYPFNNFGRLFYFYVVLIPIIGWFAYAGYIMSVIENVLKGKDKELPKFGNFWENFKKGFWLFLLVLGIGIISSFVQIVGSITTNSFIYGIGIIISVIISFISPVLIINYVKTKNFSKGFDFKFAFNLIFSNFGEYFFTFLKVLVIMIVFVLMSIPIVTLIITIPAMSYNKYYLYVDFFRRRVK